MRTAAVTVAALTIAGSATGWLLRPQADPTVAIPLVDRFTPEQIAGRRTPTPPLPVAWRFAEMAPGWSWSAGPGAADVAVTDGRLVGTAATARPVLELRAPGPQGGGDTLHAVEVTLRASAGSELIVNPLGAQGPPAAAFAGAQAPRGLAAPLILDGTSRTYTFTLARSFALGPVERRAIERVVVRPTDAAGATFAIESVRLVFRRDHVAAVPSGIGWYGLDEIWRESLVTRPGEIVRLPVRLPGRPFLDLAVGTLSETPVAFRVAVRRGDEEETVLRHTVTTADTWHPDPVALDAWAGKDVEIVLSTESDNPDALAFWGSPAIRNRGAGTAAADADRPQGVIVVVADTLRRDHLDAWGYDRATAPNLARLAREGVRFDDAVAQGVWTKVSFPSFLASLYPSTHGITDFTHRLPASATTIAEAYRAAGYATFATSSIPFSGQLTNLQQGVEVLHESRSFRPAEERLYMKTAREYVNRTLDWIELHRDVPFMVTLHLADPHQPYQPFEPYDRMWTDPADEPWFRAAEERVRQEIPTDPRKRFAAATRDELARAGIDATRFVRHEKGWYDGSIRAMDAEIGRLLDRLEHLGLGDRVAIAFLADHGEEFLEHGSHFHGLNVYGENTNVPLMLWAPAYLPGGVEVLPTVQLVDLMPTLLELSGLPVPETAQGRSLLGLARATSTLAAHGTGRSTLGAGPGAVAAGTDLAGTWRERPAFSERALRPSEAAGAEARTGLAMVKGRWKIVRHDDPLPGRSALELYDHHADPLNLRDVAAAHPDVVRELAAELETWHKWAVSERIAAEDTGTVDAAELARLQALGYIN